jgi:hypothetical protein
MPDRQQRFYITVSEAEAETLARAASQQGVAISQYLYTKVFEANTAPPSDGVQPPANNVNALLRHLIYIANRIHIATFAIPETAGTLTSEQLQAIYKDAAEETTNYLAALPQHLANTQGK